MKAMAEIVAETDGTGRTLLTCLRSQAPLVLRARGSEVWLVGGAGGPLGGDELSLRIVVRAGAELTVRSVAAMIIQPGAQPIPAVLAAEVELESDAELDWQIEPTVITESATLHSSVAITMEPYARLRWREAVVLAGASEAGGTIVSRWRLERGGIPVLDQETRLGPASFAGWNGPAVVSAARMYVTTLTLGTPVDPSSVQPLTRISADRAQGTFVVAEDAILTMDLASNSAVLANDLPSLCTRKPA